MASDEVYAAVIRQATHDAVRALLTAPADSVAGSLNLREVTDWVATEHGAARCATSPRSWPSTWRRRSPRSRPSKGGSALVVLDGWFHDVPVPAPS